MAIAWRLHDGGAMQLQGAPFLCSFVHGSAGSSKQEGTEQHRDQHSNSFKKRLGEQRTRDLTRRGVWPVFGGRRCQSMVCESITEPALPASCHDPGRSFPTCSGQHTAVMVCNTSQPNMLSGRKPGWTAAADLDLVF